jgi:hypothetical protein
MLITNLSDEIRSGTSGWSSARIALPTAPSIEDDRASTEEMRTYVKLTTRTLAGTKAAASLEALVMKMIVRRSPRKAWTEMRV